MKNDPKNSPGTKSRTPSPSSGRIVRLTRNGVILEALEASGHGKAAYSSPVNRGTLGSISVLKILKKKMNE